MTTPIAGINHFVLEELVGPDAIDLYGVERCLWWLDKPLVFCLDRLVMTCGPIVINNWRDGGEFKESGLRLFSTNTGANRSDHKFGRAFDLKPRKYTVTQLFEHIKANPIRYPEITCIEDPLVTKTWLHVANRWHGGEGLMIVKP